MSLTYADYRLIVNGIMIDNTLIQKGSYSFAKEKRIANSFKDAALIEHQQVLPTRKVVINFSLRERDLAEQDSLKGIFGVQENVPVTYWDDYECEYKSSVFYMSTPKFSHRNAIGGLNYAPTPITLTEY